MVPHAKNGFDPSRHLARGDIIFSDNEAIVLVKWSKTIQSRDNVARVVIPKLPGSKLCPVTALSNMLHLVPGSNNDPLFAIFKANKWSPLTDSMVKKHLKRVLLLLQLQLHNFTFHTFRRSGASWAFIYLWLYVAFNTVQVISRRVVGRAEETSTYSSLGLCTVNSRPTASNYQLSHLRPSQGSNPGLRGGRQECYHSATVSWDFEHGVPIEVIKQQGTWSSDCVWRYIQKSNSPLLL